MRGALRGNSRDEGKLWRGAKPCCPPCNTEHPNLAHWLKHQLLPAHRERTEHVHYCFTGGCGCALVRRALKARRAALGATRHQAPPLNTRPAFTHPPTKTKHPPALAPPALDPPHTHTHTRSGHRLDEHNVVVFRSHPAVPLGADARTVRYRCHACACTLPPQQYLHHLLCNKHAKAVALRLRAAEEAVAAAVARGELEEGEVPGPGSNALTQLGVSLLEQAQQQEQQTLMERAQQHQRQAQAQARQQQRQEQQQQRQEQQQQRQEQQQQRQEQQQQEEHVRGGDEAQPSSPNWKRQRR